MQQLAPRLLLARRERAARAQSLDRGRRRLVDLPTSAVGSLLVVALVLLHVWNPPLVESVRLKVFDELQLLDPRVATPLQQTVVIDIDDASLHEFGQWPWPRTLLAELTRRLGELGARVVGFDIIFSEGDRYSPAAYATVIERRAPALSDELRRLPDNDEVMAEAFREVPVVLGVAAVPQPIGSADEAASRGPGVAVLGADPTPFLPIFPGRTPLVPALRDAALGAGLVTMTPDVDGIVRRVPLIAGVGDRILPDLALEMLRVLDPERAIVVRADERGVRGVNLHGLFIPTDPDGLIWIRYRQDQRVATVSAADVLAGRVDREQIAGRVVLVGSSAAGLGDIKTTPGGAAMPGVEIHAQLLETLTSGDHLSRPAIAPGGERALLLVVGLALAWFGPMLRAAWLPPLLAFTMAGGALGTWLAYRGGLLVDGVYIAIALAVLLFWLAMAKFIREEAQRQTIRRAFGLYLSPVMVDKLTSSRRELKLGGERRELTILFSDIRGFTTLSERYTDDPEGLTSLLNRYLTVMTEVIQDAGGTVDKYIGDAIMAFWNAPLPMADHARAACLAALEMRRRLAGLNAELAAQSAAEGLPFEPLRFGVGINTGTCFVGNLGSNQRFNYSVIGDPVNIASRLEACSKIYGIDIIVGETARAAASDLALLELDRAQLVGKTQATRIYGLLDDAEAARQSGFADLAAAQEAMLRAYRARDWDGAERQLARCRALGASYGLTRCHDLHAARIRTYRQNPPSPAWDGSELADTKA